MLILSTSVLHTIVTLALSRMFIFLGATDWLLLLALGKKCLEILIKYMLAILLKTSTYNRTIVRSCIKELCTPN